MKREKILEKERNLVEYKSISGSIDASSEEDNSEDEYISMNSLENIRSGKKLNTNINARDARLKICD